MQSHHSSYPVRIVSRSVAKKRSRRISWFVLGTAFGLGCASAVSPGLIFSILPESWTIAKELAPPPPSNSMFAQDAIHQPEGAVEMPQETAPVELDEDRPIA